MHARFPQHPIFYLYPPHLPGGPHPRSDIDCVSPDVVLGLLGADHARHHRALKDKVVTEVAIVGFFYMFCGKI